MEAAEAGADYVAFGAFFDTATKAAKTRAEPEILIDLAGDRCRPRAWRSAGSRWTTAGPWSRRAPTSSPSRRGVWNHPDGPAAAVAAFNAEIAKGLAERG